GSSSRCHRPRRKWPWAVSVAEWRRHYLPFPDEVTEDYLGEDEHLVQLDHAPFRPALVRACVDLVLSGIAVATIALSIARPHWLNLGVALAVELATALHTPPRLGERFVAYATTNLRLLRISGVVGRKVMTIPWRHITGITLVQPATIRIEAP